MRPLAALLFGTTLFSTALGAQGRSAGAFPTSDPVLQRIWAQGMDSSHTERLAQVLFDSIGPRLTGSPGYAAAGDWVMRQYKAWGIDTRRDGYGTWRGWKRGTSHIDLVSDQFVDSVSVVLSVG